MLSPSCYARPAMPSTGGIALWFLFWGVFLDRLHMAGGAFWSTALLTALNPALTEIGAATSGGWDYWPLETGGTTHTIATRRAPDKDIPGIAWILRG